MQLDLFEEFRCSCTNLLTVALGWSLVRCGACGQAYRRADSEWIRVRVPVNVRGNAERPGKGHDVPE